MAIDWSRIYTITKKTVIGGVLTAGIVTAVRKRLQLAKSDPFYLVGLDGIFHRCRLYPGNVIGKPEQVGGVYGPPDEFAVSLFAFQLSPDGQMLLSATADSNDSYILVEPVGAGGVAFSGTDNMLMSYFPNSIASNGADIPTLLAEAQKDYDANLADGAAPAVLTASLNGDNLANNMGAFFTAGNDLILEGFAELKINPPSPFPPDFSSYWLQLRRIGGAWQRIGYGFHTSPAVAAPTPKLAFSFGAQIPGAGGRLTRTDGSKTITNGSQLLVDGKPAKLPAALAAGVMGYTGPW